MNINKIRVKPRIPENLKPLLKIASNIWYSWNHDAIGLFHRIDPELWQESNHNPILMLGLLPQETLDEISSDDAFISQMKEVEKKLDKYMQVCSYYNFKLNKPADFQVAYFSAEYGLTESIPIYSGGLGILAGEHLKSASDLCLPVVGIGLLYQRGYFRQYLNLDGWQQEVYPDNDFYNMPISIERDENGNEVKIEVNVGSENLKARIWKVQVGKVSLFLLDANIPENPPHLREITYQLYGGDWEMRIKQEILLGIGGVRAIEALGLKPTVFHINEGHSAFASLERIRILMKKFNLTFDEAREAVFASNVFTTHTPVPAGNDRFERSLIEKYFFNYVKELGISIEDLLALGKEKAENPNESFCMTVLALKMSAFCNGVSKLHETVSKKMWQGVWKNLRIEDVPITHITNGIHVSSWVSKEMAGLYSRYLNPNWSTEPDNTKVWSRIDRIPDSELWRTHEVRRERLVAFVRKRLREQLVKKGAPRKEIERAEEVLNPEALTIGFARRVATYKRAYLLFKDPERLLKILKNPGKPVQIIIAGKAHPQDYPAKEIIKNIVHLIRQDEFRNNVVFLEDYDMNVARYLVQGVDLWLNTPRRPLEACGTSGMKVSPNGGLNLSILDGWWDEGYNGENGWAIGSGEEYRDLEYQDNVESKMLYYLLENEIVPLFYKRGVDALPRGWIKKMKVAMKTLIPFFNTHRMIENYIEKFYIKAAKAWDELSVNNFKNSKELYKWKKTILEKWNMIKIIETNVDGNGEVVAGDKIKVSAIVKLSGLSAEDVNVNIYYGPLTPEGDITDRNIKKLNVYRKLEDDLWEFSDEILCTKTGLIGITFMVHPYNQLVYNPLSMNLVLWS